MTGMIFLNRTRTFCAICLSLFLPLLTLSAQSGYSWTWYNPLPTGNTLSDVALTSDGIVIAVGYNGEVLRSENKGITWKRSIEVSATDYSAVDMSGEHAGVIGTRQGDLFYTTDGGISWIRSDANTDGWISDIVMLDDSHVIAVGGNLLGKSVALQSSDGGATWETLTLPISDRNLTGLNFEDDQHGWILGERGLILYTEDRGSHWSDRSYPATEFSLRKLKRVDSRTYVAVGDENLIIRSTDGGSTWGESTSIDKGSRTDLVVIDSLNLYAIGPQSCINSTNGGKSWLPLGKENGAYALVELQDGTWLTVGESGHVRISSTVGEKWKLVSSGEAIGGAQQISFGNDKTGVVAAGGGGLMYTRDGGKTWDRYFVSVRKQFRDIVMLPSGFSMAVGDSGQNAYGGIDQLGMRWRDGGTRLNSAPYYVAVDANPSGFAMGVGTDPTKFNPETGEDYTGRVVLTRDGGNSGFQYGLYHISLMSAIDIFDDSSAYIGGAYGGLILTTDKAATWTIVPTPIQEREPIRHIRFIDRNHGVLVSTRRIFQTEDGGSSWVEWSGPEDGEIKRASFFDLRHGGLIYTRNGIDYVAFTHNGGATWVTREHYVEQIPTLPIEFNGIQMDSANTAWITGVHSYVLRYREDPPASVPDVFSAFPASFTCFPNPVVSPHFTIKSSSASPVVAIEIVNTDGSIILRQSIEEQQTSYSIHLPLMARGAYIVRMSYIDGHTESQNIILSY